MEGETWGLQSTGSGTVLLTTIDDGGELQPERVQRARPAGANRMKSQNAMDDSFKLSRKTVEKLATEMERGNDFFHLSSVRFEEATNRLEDMNLMSMFPPGGAKYKAVMSDYMAKREKLNKCMRGEELAQCAAEGNISRSDAVRSDEGDEVELHDDGDEYSE